MGDKINIRVVAANLTKRQLDYEWVVEGGAVSNSRGGDDKKLKTKKKK
jgi:ribonuclease R